MLVTVARCLLEASTEDEAQTIGRDIGLRALRAALTSPDEQSGPVGWTLSVHAEPDSDATR